MATLPKTATNQIVILIRGDLLKQYPNAIVYLAKKNAAGKPDYSDQVFPVFEGQLPPDVGFLGFPIADAQACLIYTSPSPRDATLSRMPSSA